MQKSNKSKRGGAIVGILIVLCILGALVYFSGKKKSKDKPATPKTTQVQKPKTTPQVKTAAQPNTATQSRTPSQPKRLIDKATRNIGAAQSNDKTAEDILK